MTAPVLKTRKPTGKVPWPLILVEGGEKVGKSWAIAELSASPKVGRTIVIDLAEGAADEYGEVPGARYEIGLHDGTFSSILEQVTAARAEAARVAAAGEPPMVLAIDPITAEWELLKAQADLKARRRYEAKKRRPLPDDVEPTISMDLWNEANAKHRRLMTLLLTFPGIVVLAARGKDVAALDKDGRPIEGSREYRVEGQKNLAFDATVWLRLSRDAHPTIIGARSVHAGVRPGMDRARQYPGLTLEKLIFDVLKCDPVTAHVRDLVELQPDEPDTATPATRSLKEIAAEALRPETTAARIRELYGEIGPMKAAMVPGENGAEVPIAELLIRLGRARAAGEPADQQAHRRMHALWGKAGITDRAERLAFTSEILGRDIASSTELTAADAVQVIDRLGAYIQQQTPPAPAEAAAA